MKRAFLYTRVSTERQEVEAQRSQGLAFANYHGYELVALPDEIGVSGSVKFARRPVGAEIMRRLAEVDAIIFPKVDRGFRDTVDAILTVEAFREAGKAVHFLDIGMDTTTALGQAFFEMSAVWAKLERRRIGERIREKMAEAAKRDDWRCGPAAYGYRNLAVIEDGRKVNGGRQAVVLEEAPTIARIVELRRAGKSHREIAHELQSNCVPTRRGGSWHAETVRRILARSGA